MANSRHIARHRARLLAEDPHCAYCGREVVYFKPQQGKALPGNFATIEHVYTRIEGRRPRQGQQILACLDCNHDKGGQDERAYWGSRPFDGKHRPLTTRLSDLYPSLGTLKTHPETCQTTTKTTGSPSRSVT
jgi:hypothetical protein